MLSSASIFLPNFLRALTMVLTIIVLISMPRAVQLATKGNATKYALLLVVGFELLALGRFAAMVKKWDQPLVWNSTPLTFVSMLIIAVYIYMIFKRGDDAS